MSDRLDRTRREEAGGFPLVAGTVSLAMPVIAMLLSTAWTANKHGLSEEAEAVWKMVVGLGVLACIGAGLVCAIIALCNVGKYDNRALLRRGVVGLIVNGIFVAFLGLAFIGGVAKGVKARQTEREIVRATQELRDNTRKSFDSTMGITNANSEHLGRFRAQLENAAPHLEGDKALLARVWAAYLGQVQAASKRWQSMYDEVGAAKVLDFSEVTSKEQLQSRRELVKRYKAASDDMRELVENGSDFYRGELHKLGASSKSTEIIVHALQEQNSRQRALLLEIRDLDTRISESMLGILALLEQHWGNWTCPSGPVVFFDSKVLAEYNRLLHQLKEAGREQLDAQRKLVSAR